ncbi:hypothetical protein V8V75_16100 [Peribacillus frigoritolerans]|uniref:hypothetical protein n=1 Tax=Peribacillus frigoritolerans TaxID=450367 RepID=UPI00300AB186
MKKDAFALRVDHVQPNVNIQDRINEASLHLKNIFQDIRKEGKIQLEKIVLIKAKVAPVIAKAAMNPDLIFIPFSMSRMQITSTRIGII